MNQDLPSFVVMHETRPRGEDGIWSPGFLPKTHQPLLLDARQRERIDNLARAQGMSETWSRGTLNPPSIERNMPKHISAIARR